MSEAHIQNSEIEEELIITCKQKLLWDSDQAILGSKTSGCTRQIYNAGRSQREMAYQMAGKSLGYIAQCEELTEAKKEFPYLSEVPSQCLQQALRDLNTAYQRFFHKLSGYPDFRRKYVNESFTIPQGFSQPIRTGKRRGCITLPKFGKVYFRWTRKIPKVKQIKIILETDGWFICFSCQDDFQMSEEEQQTSKTIVGIDRNAKNNNTLVLSNGTRECIPLDQIKKILADIAYQQRKLAKKKKGSGQYQRLRHKIALMHRRIFYLRDNWCHQTSTKLAKNHSLIFVEDLNLTGMTQSAAGTKEHPGTNVAAKSGLNKVLLNSGLGKSIRYLQYKMRRRSQYYSHLVLYVPPPHTSDTCSECQYSNALNREDNTFKCLKCGYTSDADDNAARNILFVGLVRLINLVVLASGWGVRNKPVEMPARQSGSKAPMRKRSRNQVSTIKAVARPEMESPEFILENKSSEMKEGIPRL